MNVLHTSDWHLGQHFFDCHRFEEHKAFLAFLLETIKKRQVDLLIVAGDIFDTANPPREAEKLYFSFLAELSAIDHCTTVVVGGNHDSPSHLNAPAAILESLRVHVVGSLPEDLETCLVRVPLHGLAQPAESKTIWVAAIPYLRDRDVRKAVAGESFDEMEERTRAGVIATYTQMAELIAKKKIAAPLIGTGHLTALGSSVSDSERTIHIGNVGSISASHFPECFDYVALGHLHRAQAVGGKPHIRYSGSPIPLSFSEADHQKEVRLLTWTQDGFQQEKIPVPCLRRLCRIKGDVERLKEVLSAFDTSKDERTPWLELIIKGGFSSPTVNQELRELAHTKGAQVLKVGVAHDEASTQDLFPAHTAIRELTPSQIFEKRLTLYDESQGSPEPETRTKVTNCFQMLLTQAEEER